MTALSVCEYKYEKTVSARLNPYSDSRKRVAN